MSKEKNIKFRDVESSDASTILEDTKGARLALAVSRQPVPPCVNRGDGKPCEYYRRCATELQACRAFYAYTREPIDRKEYSEWLQMERVPTKKGYIKVYANKAELAAELRADAAMEQRRKNSPTS